VEAGKKVTQNEQLLAWLLEDKPITPLEALDQFGINRLAARIHDLRAKGWEIDVTTKEVRTRAGTAQVAEYRLA
jgi:hypothetical protein